MASQQTRPATSAGTAIIVGASLSGLMTALSLSRVGMTVMMLQRSDDNGRTGAALAAIEVMLERLTGKPPPVDQPAMPGGIQTWVATAKEIVLAGRLFSRDFVRTARSRRAA